LTHSSLLSLLSLTLAYCYLFFKVIRNWWLKFDVTSVLNTFGQWRNDNQ
jgi:hypothetical protein